MKRRDIIFGAGALVLATIAHAQAPRRHRLGIFGWGLRKDMWGGDLERILDELARLGYKRGVRLEVFERYAQSEEELDRFARELVAIPVDVILTEGTGQTFMALNATKVIPIVTTVGDPVESGFARTLRNPGGNVTGVSQNRARLVTKVIELLRLMRPGITEVGVLGEQPKGLALAATSVEGIRLHKLADPEKGLEKSLEKLKAWHIDTAFSSGYGIRSEEAAIAIRYRIALIGRYIGDVEAGALMAADTDGSGEYVRVAGIIDKIFRGQKPADIPFEIASRFVIAVNARTAAALGIPLTPEVLLRVDRVVE